MKAEAHQEAIPACATTWKRTRYLMEGAQAIGRRGVVLSSESGLDASLRPDDALDGTLDGKEPSCAFVDIGTRMENRADKGGGRGNPSRFLCLAVTESNREAWRWEALRQVEKDLHLTNLSRRA